MSRRRMEPDADARGGRRRLLQSIAAVSVALFIPRRLLADTTRVAVIYPEMTGAYAQVFGNIISGLETLSAIRLLRRTFLGEPIAAEVERWLDDEQAQGVVALGQGSCQFARQLQGRRPIVIGAALLAPEDPAGITLAADPELMFAHLERLAPPVKRVFLIHNARTSGWMVPLARASAQRRGIELVAREVHDSREAALAYRRVVEEEAREGEDALWLPLDSAAPDVTVLAMVLEAAWRKRLVIFSNNASHARKGALFALFPDDQAMGRRLGELLLKIGGGGRGEVMPLREVKVAVNVRTASHLGKVYSSGEQRGFALVFPSE